MYGTVVGLDGLQQALHTGSGSGSGVTWHVVPRNLVCGQLKLACPAPATAPAYSLAKGARGRVQMIK
jgi:hypothetical protein